ncbi:MAG: nucleotidyltransferase family protein [Pseudomonadota bacterium]|jgi:predicted nucleotidyltransferase
MNDQNRWGLPSSTLAELLCILQAEPAVQRAILFGSRAKGTFKRGSDIDLALEGNDLNAEAIGRLARAFDESPIPYQVDLCWLDAVNHPALRDHIARVGQVLYERASPASHSVGV